MRAIDADRLSFLLQENFSGSDDVATIQLFIDDKPTLEVAPVVHAHWVHPIRGNVGSYCSHCKRSTERLESGTYFEPDYCPRCGARMDEEDKR